MVIIAVIISVICYRRRRQDHSTWSHPADNFMHIACRDMDAMRPGTPVKNLQSMNEYVTGPRCGMAQKQEPYWGESIPLDYNTSDQELTEYENDTSGQVSH